MPTATPFTALGKGNGFPFCCPPIDIINDPTGPTYNRYRWYELCPEAFTLEEVMSWYWNASDYTSTVFRWGEFDTANNEWEFQDTFYLNLAEARSAMPDENIAESQAGVLLDGLGMMRDIEPYKRVCNNNRITLRFTTGPSGGALFRVEIAYDESNNNYRFLVVCKTTAHGTRKYVERYYPITDTMTLTLPITPSKNISIPMAASASYRFISTTPGSLVSYTY